MDDTALLEPMSLADVEDFCHEMNDFNPLTLRRNTILLACQLGNESEHFLDKLRLQINPNVDLCQWCSTSSYLTFESCPSFLAVLDFSFERRIGVIRLQLCLHMLQVLPFLSLLLTGVLN